VKVKPKVRTPISYYGGKQIMARHIVPVIPQHKIYTEAFIGGAAIFFLKDRAEVEVINDLNGEVVNFYKVITTDFWRLNELIQSTLHSRAQYEDAMVIYNYPQLFNPVKRAWAFWVLTNQGYSSKIGSWGYDRSGDTTTMKISNKKIDFDVNIRLRLEHAQIECNDALKVIASRDTPEAFHYIDPPYIGSNMGHYSGYTENDYEKLLELLGSCQGKFLLSGYQSKPLEAAIKRNQWYVRHYDKQLSASTDKAKRKVEVLVSNFEFF
jgi:DNA adenine methylase